MRDAGVIGSLSCNGTNGTNGGGSNSIDPGSPAPASISNSGLSTATSASIGMGVGNAAIGIITAFTWLNVHYRRKLRGLTAKSHDIKN
ncbi:hypothetical protein PG993_009993 [Apiospora rasikravindrae]|uniref:Uncharacterized protein n=1 Tax=Apiospora rasikravindrae TaxID=990691 RepID=A0ABR1SNA8_9PEZI